MRSKRTKKTNPLESPEYAALRTVARALARGGAPLGRRGRTPSEEARAVAALALRQMLGVLDGFRQACARGEQVHLAVVERAASPNRIVIDIAVLEAEEART